MAFTANVTCCTSIFSYEAAARLFNEPLHKQRKDTWKSHQRPLDTSRKHHLRVERYEDYYDVVLYQTVMARYYKPEIINGKVRREVHYNCDSRQTSTLFQYHVLGINERTKFRATDGRLIKVGFNKDASGLFPIRLVFLDDRLDLTRSVDAPNELSHTTSQERKKARAAFKKWLRPYAAMAVMETTGGSCINPIRLKHAYEAGEMIDPTDLVKCIRTKGVAWVVNRVYPRGDIRNFEQPFGGAK